MRALMMTEWENTQTLIVQIAMERLDIMKLATELLGMEIIPVQCMGIRAPVAVETYARTQLAITVKVIRLLVLTTG